MKIKEGYIKAAIAGTKAANEIKANARPFFLTILYASGAIYFVYWLLSNLDDLSNSSKKEDNKTDVVNPASSSSENGAQTFLQFYDNYTFVIIGLVVFFLFLILFFVFKNRIRRPESSDATNNYKKWLMYVLNTSVFLVVVVCTIGYFQGWDLSNSTTGIWLTHNVSTNAADFILLIIAISTIIMYGFVVSLFNGKSSFAGSLLNLLWLLAFIGVVVYFLESDPLHMLN